MGKTTLISQLIAKLKVDYIFESADAVAASDSVWINALWDKARVKVKAENLNELLLIIDEIQTGFGRTGSFWAFEQFGIYPDVITSAKGMGGGMPIGAFIANKDLMGAFKNNPLLGHITTFGGHPVSAAASLATIKVIQEEKLLEQVETKANLFKKLLVHPKIRSIRNKGLMMAVEFESFEVLKPIIDRAIENGVITDWREPNVIRLAPAPFYCSFEDMYEFGHILKKGLSKP